MQRVDKTIYKDIPDNVLDNGETFQKPDYIGSSEYKLKQMFVTDDSMFLFTFQNNASLEYHQRMKSPELVRRIQMYLNK